MRHDDTPFDVACGEAFKSGFAAVGVNELAKERQSSTIDWKVIGRRVSQGEALIS